MFEINYNFDEEFVFTPTENRFFVNLKSISYYCGDNKFYLYNWGSSPTTFESSYSDYVIIYV